MRGIGDGPRREGVIKGRRGVKGRGENGRKMNSNKTRARNKSTIMKTKRGPLHDALDLRRIYT
jgi:hypothetical protein